VPSSSEGMELELRVEGMSCQHCVAAVTGAVGSIPGVEDVAVDLETGLVKVRGHAGSVQREQVVEAIQAAGYRVDAGTGGDRS
jgi:copper chaperone